MTASDTRADSLKGRHVIDKGGFDLGQVEDVTLDPKDWRVTGLIIRVNKNAGDRLHLDRPIMGNAHVQVGAARIETVADNILLNVAGSDIAALLYEGPDAQ